MPKYLVQATYTGDGVQGLLKEGGSSRRTAVKKLFSSLGGKMEVFYFALGDTDAFIIGDLPDNVSAAAASLIVNAAGATTSIVTVLLSPEDIDEASKKNPVYRAPGE